MIYDKLLITIAAVTLAVSFSAISVSGATTINKEAKKNKAKILKEKWHKPPKNVKHKVKFTPTGEPSVSQVFKIAAYEQAKWGGSSLLNRIHCESTYNWSVTNGQYQGLLQFGPIWYSMWAGTPRQVKIVNKTVKKKRIVRFRKWSHLNKWVRKPRKTVRQNVWTVKIGKLPKSPSAYHGHASIRVAQRAVSGHGKTTSWACPL